MFTKDMQPRNCDPLKGCIRTPQKVLTGMSNAIVLFLCHALPDQHELLRGSQVLH